MWADSFFSSHDIKIVNVLIKAPTVYVNGLPTSTSNQVLNVSSIGWVADMKEVLVPEEERSLRYYEFSLPSSLGETPLDFIISKTYIFFQGTYWKLIRIKGEYPEEGFNHGIFVDTQSSISP